MGGLMTTTSLVPPVLPTREGAFTTNVCSRAEVEREHAEDIHRALEALSRERRRQDAAGLFQVRFPDPREEIARLNDVVRTYRDLAGALGDKLDEAEREVERLRGQSGGSRAGDR